MFLAASQIESFEKASDEASVKKCPQCISTVPSEAKVCAHCGHSFESKVEH